jgi:hypothetical protein
VPENFAKKDNCYTVTTDGVPDYNIFLYISKNEQDVKTAEDYLPQIIIAMFYAEFIMIFVKFLTAGIVLLIYAAKKK